MSLRNRIRRFFCVENMIWCGVTVLIAVVFLTIGLTAPSLPGFQNKETIKVIYADGSSESEPDSSIVENTSIPDGKIPLNTATKEQLMSVSGIGEVYAQRIIDYRTEIGSFTDLAQLKNIKGIGETRFSNWAPHFTLD